MYNEQDEIIDKDKEREERTRKMVVLKPKEMVRCGYERCGAAVRNLEALELCSGCHLVMYCCQDHQRRARKEHKPHCRLISEAILDPNGSAGSQRLSSAQLQRTGTSAYSPDRINPEAQR